MAKIAVHLSVQTNFFENKICSAQDKLRWVSKALDFHSDELDLEELENFDLLWGLVFQPIEFDRLALCPKPSIVLKLGHQNFLLHYEKQCT